MKSIQHLKYLAILTVVELTSHGAGLNVVPALPEPASNTANSVDTKEEVLWYSSWNNPPLHSWKGIDLRSTVDYKAFYTDRSLSTAGVSNEDFLHYVSPLISLSRSFETEQRATLVSIAYQPTFVISSMGNGGDRTYQLLRGNLSHLWNDKSIYLSHQFQESSETSQQAAFLTPQQDNQTAAGFRTPLSGKMNAEFGIEQSLSDLSGSKISQTRELRLWGATAHIDYQLRPKLETGMRLKVGFSEQLGNAVTARFVSEGLVSTWSYQVSGKLKVNLDAGGQLVQSQTASIQDPRATPTAIGRIVYEPRYGTALVLGGGRSANASQFFSANFVTESGCELSVQQRVYQDFSLSGRVGYLTGEYQELIPSASKVSRDYSSYTFNANCQWRVNARVTVGLFYQYLNRSSDLASESYSANQVGMSLALSL